MKDQITLVFVYIREAQPNDEWQSAVNVEEGVIVRQPQSLKERHQVAETCRLGLKLQIPMLVDGMENSTDAHYGAWPNRLYVVNSEGRIFYKSGPGPFGFRIGPFEEALERCLAQEKAPHMNWR